ncbi:MAG: redoxin domain-containing protein, partial [Chitinophagaceae bacterium]|nr:redoxin domain-containing protein [Chitinophagaceae bacterium]
MRVVFWLMALSLPVFSTAQNNPGKIILEVGKPCPNFDLSEIQYYNKRKAVIDDFKGNWLVLDFWSRTCSSCIEKMPAVNNMQKRFGDTVKFMLVGYAGSKLSSPQYRARFGEEQQLIKTIYEKTRIKNKLDLSVVYDS